MKFEARVSLAYLILAALWIIVSDALVAAIPIPDLVHTLQTYKGALFVVVTALLLFAVLRWEVRLRHRSDQAVLYSESRFRYLFLNNPLPMWVYDLDTLRFLDVNAAALDQYGYSREEFLSMRLSDIRPSEEVPRLLKHLQQERSALQQSGIWQHRYKDGTIIDVEIISHTLEFHGRRSVLAVAQNVTERVRAQAALHTSNATLNAIITAAPLAIFRFNPDGRIQFCNPAAEQIFGWSAAELIGQPPPFVPPDKHDEFLAIIDQALDSEKTIGYITTRQRKDGTPVTVSVSAAPIQDANGRPLAVVSLVADVTERQQMEAERHEKERLQLALNKEIELRNLRLRFMSMVSHEFRNPLAIVASSSSMLERYYDRMQPKARREHFATVEAQVKRLSHMLDEILTILRSEAIGANFKPTPLDLIDVCRQLTAESDLQAQQTRQIKLNCTLEQAPMQGDVKLLREAIGNLLTNAIKYSSPDQPVRVDVSREAQHYCIRVSDQGIGIPAENLKRLFEPFYRADNVGEVPGSGLGLTIARQACELHGGALTVDSTIGVGSTFTICLPAGEAE